MGTDGGLAFGVINNISGVFFPSGGGRSLCFTSILATAFFAGDEVYHISGLAISTASIMIFSKFFLCN